MPKERESLAVYFGRLCGIFCCPPIPSRITSKLAFRPPEATYTFLKTDDTTLTLSLRESADFPFIDQVLDTIDVFFCRTTRGNSVACMFVRCVPDPSFTILFSHGNAQDLGQMSGFYFYLGSLLNCNIFSYDYSGYGMSSGRPTEKNMYADMDAAWYALQNRYGISADNTILYGLSIGTVPTVDLAARYEVGGVILHSPFMSGMRVAFPNIRKTSCLDAFPNIDKVSKVRSPVLVIHGTEDKVVNISHGMAIFERCPRTVEPLWVEGAGHNDVPSFDEYLERLKQFVSVDLDQSTSTSL